jgi:UDP-N-acetylmuramoyl-tripeptide--D-alanyl-D-alanine ligase
MSAAMLWKTDALAAAMKARMSGQIPDGVTGLSIDSRTVAAGEAFFAIKGDNRDGHEFVEAALAAGAALAIIAADCRTDFAKDAPLLIVDEVLRALYDLARAARARSKARIVAVTGSVGKTGTKEALRLALSRSGRTHASAASYNNHWGVPLSLARMPANARFGVFEIGMNHAGEITPLTKLVRPHVAIVTTVEPVHLEYFGTVDAIADAKAEIFSGLEPDGAAILNLDNPQFKRLQQAAGNAGVTRIVRFGEHPQADARLLRVSLQEEFSTVDATILGNEITYKVGTPGRHVVLNSLAVLAGACLAGGDLALAALAMAELQAPVGRGARTRLILPDGGSALLIDESYNANPASMRAALAVLGQAPLGRHGRRIAVLGDMLELGAEGAALHRGLAEAVVASGADLVLCAGPLMRQLCEVLPPELQAGYAASAPELEPILRETIRDGDAVMVKGSLGSRMGTIVKLLLKHFAQADSQPAL